MGSTACNPLDWRWLSLLCCSQVLSPLGWTHQETALSHHLTQSILCSFNFGIMASCKAFCLLTQLFLLVSDQKRWSGPSPWSETRSAPQWLPCTCIFWRCPVPAELIHVHYFTLLAFGKLLLTYDPNWFCCQLFLVLPRHIVVISPSPQNYLLSAWNPFVSEILSVG